MANPNVILCGDVSEPRGGALPLRLSVDAVDGNVHLKVENLLRSISAQPTERLLDLIQIAAFVYAADGAISRGGSGVHDFGADWRRQLHFRIAVDDLEFWSRVEVRDCLEESLSYLSDDVYVFEFEKRRKVLKQKFIEFGPEDLFGSLDEVMLFSGGLDSLGGAVQAIVGDSKRVLLVTHRSTGKTAPRLRGLLNLLSEAGNKNSFVHIPVLVNKEKLLGREYTHRTRSFLFASIAAMVAFMAGKRAISFYENGIISVNLPISGQLVGGRATRTTHPKVLDGFHRLFSLVAEETFEVVNPFFWKTKTDVIETIRDHNCADLIARSNSCVRTLTSTIEHPFCGVCSQCIDRRFAVLASGVEDHDPANCYEVDLLNDQREPGEDLTMLAAYVATVGRIEAMTSRDFFREFGEAFRVLPYLPGERKQIAERLFQLFHRHAHQVGKVLNAAIRKNFDLIRSHSLPTGSLLNLVVQQHLSQESDLSASDYSPKIHADDAISHAIENEPLNFFRQRNGAWEVRFAGGKPFILLPKKGAQLLHILLASPNESFRVERLIELQSGIIVPRRSEKDADELSDEVARQALQAKLQILQQEFEEAQELSNEDEMARLDSQMQELLSYQTKATGRKGRSRRMSDSADKLRNQISKNLNAILRDIERCDRGLHKHLQRPTLTRGYSCCYQPRENIEWDTASSW